MASNVITTSLVIQFNDPNAEGFLSAEIDSRADGFNKGNTTFLFGDSPAYLVYKTPNVSITQTTTDGGIASLGSVSVAVKDYLTFANSNEASLSKPPSGYPSFTYLGGTSLALTVSGTKVIANTAGISIYRADYNTVAQAYRLSGASREAVLIFIDGIIL